MSAKKCRKCKKTKPVGDFYTTLQGGKAYPRSRCKVCDNEARKKRPRLQSEKAKANKRILDCKSSRKINAQRKDPQHYAKFIYQDSRRSDNKHGRENNLTKEFIKEQIAKGCSYCGEKKLRMTLDRIDNDFGHTMVNTVPACIRCNYARRSMPYEAWLCLKPGLRRARKQGLFGDWTGRCR